MFVCKHVCIMCVNIIYIYTILYTTIHYSELFNININIFNHKSIAGNQYG